MPAAPYTRATLRTAFAGELQDLSLRHWTAAWFARTLNDAMGDWCEQTKSRLVNGQIDIVADQAVYSLTGLSPRCIDIKRASCPTSADAADDRRLILISAEELERDGARNWRSDPSTWPTHLIRGTQGAQSLRLYPTPSSSQSATVADTVYYASQATGGLMSLDDLTVDEATAEVGGLMSIDFLCGSLQLYYVAHSTDIDDDVTTVEAACGISPDRQDALLWYIAARACEVAVPIAIREKAAGYWDKWASEIKQQIRLTMVGSQSTPARRSPSREY